MRHYVVMALNECGDEFRADEREFKYPDFDENDECASELRDRWKSAVVDMVRATYKDGEIWNSWIEREQTVRNTVMTSSQIWHMWIKSTYAPYK